MCNVTSLVCKYNNYKYNAKCYAAVYILVIDLTVRSVCKELKVNYSIPSCIKKKKKKKKIISMRS
jgi:hypothetical protein